MKDLNQMFAQCFGDCFGLGVDLQFGVDVFEMEGDGVGCDAQLRGRGLVVMPFDEQLQEFRLLRRQVTWGALRWAEFSEHLMTRRATSGDIGAPPSTASLSDSSRRAGGVFFSR